MIFKGFKQVLEKDNIEFEEGYVYLVRTNEDNEDGYIYLNGKKYGTSKNVYESFNEIINTTKESMIDLIYPIGSIYITVNNVNPEVVIGGKWEQIKDTFLLASGDKHSAGSTGGEEEHVLTIDEMPQHMHRVKTDIVSEDFNVTWPEWTKYTEGWMQSEQVTESPASQTTYTGGNRSHNNMPPYLAVYMWKRIS